MDRNFYIDSFERLLKEKTDQFRMYPTRKIWHSIYNNLYPGSRYPSVLMSVAIISAFCSISLLNVKQHKSTTAAFNYPNSVVASVHESHVPIIEQRPTESLEASNLKKNLLTDHSNNKVTYSSSGISAIKTLASLQQQHLLNHHIIAGVDAVKNKSDLLTGNNNVNFTEIENTNVETSLKADAPVDDELLNDYTLNDNHFSKRWANKLVWQIYASPYVAYGEANGYKPNSIQSQDNNSSSFDNSSIGLEAGTSMQYPLSGLFKLKAGLQFNYASYNMEAYQNYLSSDLSGFVPKSSTGVIGSGISPVTLHNEMYQFSLPVGLEFKLLQNKNLQWNLGATIQPTYLAGGNTYLLSSDSHNFIDESSALNRWNFNAGFETFITYKLDGLTWQFGPQLRYQFSSIYGRTYTPVDEKFANFGVKIGVSKIIR